MSTIEEVVARQRRALIRDDNPMLRQLAGDYRRATAELERKAQLAAGRAAAAAATGADPFAALLEAQLLQELQRQVEAEVGRISQRGPRIIAERQRAAIVSALHDGAGMALEVGVRLNIPAVERMLAALTGESPLALLFAPLAPAASRAVRDRLIEGVILGQNPRVTAHRIALALNGNGARALTIARTETLRAYRRAIQDTYRQNARLLGGWVWVAACDRRTCGVCFAMHGTRHPLDEPFGSHPSCRCSPAPLPRTLPPAIAGGAERFDELSDREQLAILGPAKLKAYQQNLITLNDLVGVNEHPRWGLVRYERSLTSILGPQARELYRSAA